VNRAHPRECKCGACMLAFEEDMAREWPNGLQPPLPTSKPTAVEVTHTTLGLTWSEAECLLHAAADYSRKRAHSNKPTTVIDGVVTRLSRLLQERR
jgi:hypothetical protein